MKRANISITTYECGEYMVDIATTSDSYEAWIYRKEYGVKDLMFGMPQAQQTLDEFLDIVEANIEDYAKGYDEEYAE